MIDEERKEFFTYNGIASGVGCHVITVGQVLEALLRHVSPEDGLGLLRAAGLGQGVWQSSDPGEGPRLGQVTEENRALVSSAEIENVKV